MANTDDEACCSVLIGGLVNASSSDLWHGMAYCSFSGGSSPKALAAGDDLMVPWIASATTAIGGVCRPATFLQSWRRLAVVTLQSLAANQGKRAWRCC